MTDAQWYILVAYGVIVIFYFFGVCVAKEENNRIHGTPEWPVSKIFARAFIWPVILVISIIKELWGIWEKNDE